MDHDIEPGASPKYSPPKALKRSARTGLALGLFAIVYFASARCGQDDAKKPSAKTPTPTNNETPPPNDWNGESDWSGSAFTFKDN